MSRLIIKKKHKIYVFDDFTLHINQCLLFNNEKINLPPKELAVLCLLVEAQGEIVTKESIIEHVWKGGVVSDESLTRCIYTIRKNLAKYEDKEFVETIYGRGYRLTCPVHVVATKEVSNSCRLAIFPFNMNEMVDEELFHHMIIQTMYKYRFTGIEVFSTTLTSDCTYPVRRSKFVEKYLPDYYLVGKIIGSKKNQKLIIELSNGKTHNVCGHIMFDYSPLKPISSILANIIFYLLEKIPNLKLNTDSIIDLHTVDVAMSCLKSKIELLKYTPSSVKLAKSILLKCAKDHPNHHLPLCYLAETYITLSQMGLLSHNNAIKFARKQLEKAILISPANYLVLGIMGLLNGLSGDYLTSKILFEQAQLLMPESIDLYYYQASTFFYQGNWDEASCLLNKCLEMDRDKIPVIYQLLWIAYCNYDINTSKKMVKNLITKEVETNPLIQSVNFLIHALSNRSKEAFSILKSISLKEQKGCIAINILYGEYYLDNIGMASEVDKFLNAHKTEQSNGYDLPLILITQGEESFKEKLSEIKKHIDFIPGYVFKDSRLKGLAI